MNFDIDPKISNTICVYINGEKIANATKVANELEKVVNFDLYLPAVRVAKAIEGHDSIRLQIKDMNGAIIIQYKSNTKEIYENEFEHISDDVNFTLSCLPLISEESVKYLKERQKLAVIKHLMDAKLEKDSAKLLSTLIKHLNDYSSVSASSELLVLQNRSEFLALLINCYRPVISNPYYVFIKQALSAMMYLDAKSLIDHSSLEEADKTHLFNQCVKPDADKFAFVEHFPASDEGGSQLWLGLSEHQRQDYWPLLANGFEYRREYKRITQYPVDYSWYTNVNHEQNSEAVKAIIQDPCTRWFGMSLIVNEFEQGATPESLLAFLQEYVWATWDQEYVNIDSFCYVVSAVLPLTNREEYSWLTSILVELFNSRLARDTNDVYRQCLIEVITQTINQGIKTVNDAFVWLAEKARHYYAFDDYFLANLNYQSLKAFDGEYYLFADSIYSKTQSIKQFVSTLSHNKAPTVNELREQFINLTYLREQQIEGTDKWILALSRYCQLLDVSDLYQELAKLHETIGDLYGALALTFNEAEKARIEHVIITSGKDEKRKDSYWFERSLDVRSEPTSTQRVLFIDELHTFLTNTKESDTYYGDLIHLLASEIIHYLMQGGTFNKIQPFLSYINHMYVAGHSAILVTDWLVNQEINLTSMNQTSTLCGEYGEFVWFINDLGHSVENVLTVEAQNALLGAIKQHYVYPYLQVMIYSCNAYEKTRHKIIRESWLPTLKAMDIDYCFVVGSAEQSHMDGDLMRLAVPDTYEALPHKSLEMFRFAHTNNHYRYYYKLDDDCVLNVHAMFGDPTFLNQAYFGRTVSRPLGGVDRSWHHKKSTTQEAKTSLDLSPEFSQYCDGSTGYILSNWAAQQLAEQVELDTNAQLINSSYFEDKLVGDLMAKANIFGVNSGYRTLVKRTFVKKYDMQIWEYGLHASIQNNIKVVHTESDEFRLKYGKCLKADSLDQRLIFRDKTQNLMPEFYSDTECSPVLERLKVNETAVRNAKHIAVIVGKNEQELLPNLLKHHRSIGIEHFLFVDNCSDDTSIDYMLGQEDVSVFVATQEYRHSRFAVNWQETLLSYYGLGRWVLIIDSDELYTYAGSEGKMIHTITQVAERDNANSFFAPMIDFYPRGELSGADVTGEQQFYRVCDHYDSIGTMQIDKGMVYGPFSNSSIYHGGLRKRIFGNYNQFPAPNYLNQKYNLLKFEPNMRLIEGLHFMYGVRTSRVSAAIMHFKYHAGFYAKVVREINSGQHWNGATEYKRYATKIDGESSYIVFDKEISCKYKSSVELLRDYNDKK
ncbi:glycosyltransferase family 2 protein [Vibrio hyugaensis]|uniref:glycosyltransferase family 2 protein n=1 Tax=Vibrio hyugaensis TaxID=1534743 RepID=UPI0015E284FD|nr:glycosyltransferase family 2 protein [Vibrio hyugaensis]